MKKLHTLLVAAASSALLLPMETHAQETTTGSNTRRDTTYTNLKEATVSVSRLVFVTKKDTIVYDIDALNASEGDMLGDIIKKMPGLELRDGTLYFKGRAVNRLMVNGVDFQRGDTKQALSVLPAYIIKHVKAYEGQTDKAKVTGIDDGEKETVVDVILRKEYMGSWTGNIDLGGGTDKRWLLRGFANTFTDRMRVSVYGGATNTGIYQSVGSNGDWSDNGFSSGDTKFIQPGTSFMWMGKKKENEAGFLKIEGGLGWDYRGHNDFNASQSEQLLSDQSMKFNVNRQTTKNDEKLWKANLYITWKPTKNTHIEYAPNYTNGRMENRDNTQSAEWDKSYFDAFLTALDSVATPGYHGDFMSGARLLTKGHTYSDSKSHRYTHWFWVSQKLTENNWRLALRNQLSFYTQSEKAYNLKSYQYFRQEGASQMDPLYNRYSPGNSRNSYMMSFLDLNIPLPVFQSLRFTYGFDYSHDNQRTNGYRLERVGGIFADFEAYVAQFGMLPTLNDWETLTRDADITKHSISDRQRHWFETSLSYKKGKIYGDLQLTGKARHDEINYWKQGYEVLNPSKKSGEFLVNSNIKWEPSSGNYAKIGYYFETTPADLSQEITIPNTADPLNISLGNADLKALRKHNIKFNGSRAFKGGKYMTFDFSWFNTINSVTYTRWFDKETSVTTTKPVNICGSWSINTNVFYNMPLDKQQHVNWNIQLAYRYSNDPSYGTSVEQMPARRNDISQSFSFYNALQSHWKGGNLSVMVLGTYNHTQTDLIYTTKKDTWNLYYILNGKQKIFWDIDFSTGLEIRQFVGYGNATVKPVRTIWNVFLSKSFLKEKNMTVKLELSDLLNQRGQYWSSITADSRSYNYGTCVKRFFMAHLIYRFSTKKGGK